MGFDANILADSISPAGHRLTTFEITFPRIILAELNTHRIFSRSSASSRAIPVNIMLKMVQEDPYVPTHWSKNQKGMSAEAELTPAEQVVARDRWLRARDSAVEHAKSLLDIGLHKQMTNRLLEPFLWHTAIVSSTNWSNWDHLRDHKAAHPEIQRSAHAMRGLRLEAKPNHLAYGEWHLPLTDATDHELLKGDPELLKKLIKISVAHCARVSYLTHDGKRDHSEDLALYDKLLASGHMSPLEHAARPMTAAELELFAHNHQLWYGGGQDGKGPQWMASGREDHFLGNFDGWVQCRKQIPWEDDIHGSKSPHPPQA